MALKKIPCRNRFNIDLVVMTALPRIDLEPELRSTLKNLQHGKKREGRTFAKQSCSQRLVMLETF